MQPLTEYCDSLLLIFPKVLVAIGIFLAFWFITKLIRKAQRRFFDEQGDKAHAIGLLTQILCITILTMGGITSFASLGYNVSALVTGLGLTGFAVGFALKDYLSNVLAGFMLIIQNPFKMRDTVKVSGVEGKLKKIDLRYTVLEQEGKTIYIPNSKIITNVVEVTEGE